MMHKPQDLNDNQKHNSNIGGHNEYNEYFIVYYTYAIVQPHTVMVKSLDALVTWFTMLRWFANAFTTDSAKII